MKLVKLFHLALCITAATAFHQGEVPIEDSLNTYEEDRVDVLTKMIRETVETQKNIIAALRMDISNQNMEIQLMKKILTDLLERHEIDIDSLNGENKHTNGQIDILQIALFNLTKRHSEEISNLKEEISTHDNQLHVLKAAISELNDRYMIDITSMKTEINNTLHCCTATQTDETPPVNDLIRCSKGWLGTGTAALIKLWDKKYTLCDRETDNGGWVIIQSRSHGDINFYRNWTKYKHGFGSIDSDFWIGNDVIHNLTSQGYNELRVELILHDEELYAHYQHFEVADEESKYRLTVSGYSGTAGDGMSVSNNMFFTTFDRDNDLDDDVNCAEYRRSAWWFGNCSVPNLNGVWGATDLTGMVWSSLNEPLTFVEMKLRHT